MGEAQMKGRCASCRFWHDVEFGENDHREGECRMSAPMIGEDDASAVWPMTYAVDWCGDHEPGLSPSGNERSENRLRIIRALEP